MSGCANFERHFWISQEQRRMKKLVFASAMALASLGLVGTPALYAQAAGGGISLPPAEFNAYQTATTENNPQQKAAALESFLQTYPQSPVKKEVLDQLMDTYRGLNDFDKELSACNRMLQIDPSNLKAMLYSVLIRQSQCSKTVNASTGVSSNPQTCDDGASLAQKGLTVAKPADVSDQDWKNETDVAYPLFHSMIALDDTASKKDFADAIKEYTQELMAYPPQQADQPGPALVDQFHLAQAYTRPGPTQDLPKAVWFYARFVDFAPPQFKAQVQPDLEYYYKRFHGGTDGLDAVEAQAKATVFPPADYKLAPAPSPADVVHKVIAETPDLTKLNLEDKEYILANGSPADQQKLWSVLQGQVTPVPGIVTGVTSTGMTVHIEVGPHIVHDYTVALKNPMIAKDIRAVPDDVQAAKQFIDQNGVPDDVAKVDHEFELAGARVRKVELEPDASVIDMAVTQDAKQNNTPDFIVNLKKPAEGKDVPAPGFEYKLLPDPELDATYASYKPVPAANGKAASAQIVLNDGFIQVQPPKAPARRAPVRRPVHHSGA
jgi:tetratricopeptide (TPR) repeat protein